MVNWVLLVEWMVQLGWRHSSGSIGFNFLQHSYLCFISKGHSCATFRLRGGSEACAQLKVRSTPEGTTFWFSIDAELSSAPAMPPAPANGTDRDPSGGIDSERICNPCINLYFIKENVEVCSFNFLQGSKIQYVQSNMKPDEFLSPQILSFRYQHDQQPNAIF